MTLYIIIPKKSILQAKLFLHRLSTVYSFVQCYPRIIKNERLMDVKNVLKGLLFVTIALVAFPVISVLMSEGLTYFDQEEAIPAFSETTVAQAYPTLEEIYICDITTGTIMTLPIEDFLTYSVLGTLQMDAEPELIKAHAVLMYTYILGRRIEEEINPTAELYGCDISTDTNKYIRLSYDGDNIEALRQAVSEVAGEYITYDGKLIAPAYCVSNGGISESALTVLGEDVPYLQSVISEYDSDYITELSYTSDELFARITTQSEGITLLGDTSDWIVITGTTDTGYITEVTLDGNTAITGKQLASWLNLPSARFTVAYSDEFDRFTFTVYGSGHLVGLSQYGGNRMAEAGYSYAEIISFYFTGVEIKKP
ncbi:MAG: SpoIID/LytB domain-containing protein [Oscillospiraceae bacterium]|nr:SpoIID/LytB domain-containing protein [Oscillospiraceae bacterium]